MRRGRRALGGRRMQARRTCVARIAIVVALVCLLAEVAQAGSPWRLPPLRRIGFVVNLNYGALVDYDIAVLRAGWYTDNVATADPARPYGLNYIPLIGTGAGNYRPNWVSLATAVANNPGRIWMVGNEPECVYQEPHTPAEYAAVYHDVYEFLKSRDPTALVAIGGVVQPTPLRLQWLDMVLAEYQARYGEKMPVDVWNIHNMILQERKGFWGCDIPVGLSATEGRLYAVDDNDSFDIFVQHVVDFRTWMKARGEQNKPLVISEYGVLMPKEYGFSVERVNAFMDKTFDYMLKARDPALGFPQDDYRLVQMWAWFSLNEEPYSMGTGRGFNGELFNCYTRQITPMGQNFAQYTSRLASWMRYFPRFAIRQAW